MSQYGSAQYRIRLIPRQGVSPQDYALCDERLRHARDAGLLDAFERTTFDGNEMIVVLNAAEMAVCNREDFQAQELVAIRVIDKVIALHSASERPVTP